MSSPGAVATPGNTPKSMSSRLLTMKFMQRAAATSPSAPSTPTPEEPAPKRRKHNTASPSVNVSELANQRAVANAIAEEEAKRRAALEKQAAEAGDTRWVLSFDSKDERDKESRPPPLRVVAAGFASIDLSTSAPSRDIRVEDDTMEAKPGFVGRRSYGRFNKKLEKQLDPTIESSSDDDSDAEEEDDDMKSEGSDDESETDDPAVKLIREAKAQAAERARLQRKAERKLKKKSANDLAKKRKKHEVNLNELTSLSGRQEPSKSIACFQCGGPHRIADCPKRPGNGNKRPPPDGQNGKSSKKPRFDRGIGH